MVNNCVVTAGLQCGTREGSCDDGTKCINEWEFCNGKRDCDDGSDEKASRCLAATTGKCHGPFL